MKKILKLLESHVQWATLALGAAFLGFMVWTYIIQNPASKTMTANHETVTVSPGTVDVAIKNGVVQTFIQKMGPTTPLSLSAPQLASLPWGPPATQPVVREAANSWPQDIPMVAEAQGSNPNVGLILNLPALPPLSYLDNEELRTVIKVPGLNGAPDGKQDQDSVTTFWTLPVAALAKAYDDAFSGKLGLADQQVVFAHADLIRQQQMPDGTWGPETTVASVPIAGQPPYPAKNATPADAAAYNAWLTADKNQKSIVSADYPPVYYAPADRPDLQWKPLEAVYADRAGQPAGAGAPNPQAVAPGAAPAPAQGGNPFADSPPPPTQPPAGGGPAQPTAPPGRAGGKRGAPGNGIASNPVIGGLGQQVAGAQPPIAQPAAPLAPPPQVPAPPPAAPAKLPPLQQVPDAAFNADAIAKQTGDLELYFHDMFVEPGATYRYKVVYSVVNPVFGKVKAVKNPADAQAFVIDSPVSGWSQPIAVPQRTRFWCSNKQPGIQLRSSGRVDFTVFVWHDGKWNKKEYPGVATGDEIGDGDFVSHFTLLGAAAPPGTEQPRQILLVPDTGGPAELRNEHNDAASADLQSFLKTVAAQTPPPDGSNPQPGPPAAGPGA